MSGSDSAAVGLETWKARLGAPVLDALDQAALPDVLLVYRAAQWAGHGVG